jgi:DNA (cytosine-5)-methyltransferase 1
VTAIFNEIEPFAADWLENLIEAGHVAKGRVERRSVRDLRPGDLDGFDQAHFFAGIGGWSLALRLAGWPDDLPVWTGSCPCQPFSVAGKRKGKEDDRHLWPVWFGLIRECRPPVVFGEQVASPDGLDWLDSVSADLEGEGYTFAAADLCAAGFGAPHARQRLYFVAHADGLTGRLQLRGGRSRPEDAQASGSREPRGVADAEVVGRGRSLAGASRRPPVESHGRRSTRCMADALHPERGTLNVGHGRDRAHGGREEAHRELGARGEVRVVGYAGGARTGRHTEAAAAAQGEGQGARGEPRRIGDGALAPSSTRLPASTMPGAVRGFWSDAEWIFCTDGLWRPVEPGSFPLAHGVPGRMGCLRAYGNAIVPWVAAGFVSAARDAMAALA